MSLSSPRSKSLLNCFIDRNKFDSRMFHEKIDKRLNPHAYKGRAADKNECLAEDPLEHLVFSAYF